MGKICRNAHYDDLEGLIYADKKDTTTNVFKKIADDHHIKIESEIIGLQFINGDFILLEYIDENNNIYNIKQHKLNITFEEILPYFKRFSFCITHKKYLDKECNFK